MKSYPRSQVVIEELGDKVVEALRTAVLLTRLDLSKYRNLLPDFVATSSPRGLANWLHDRMWHHLTSEVADLDNVFVLDKGPLREIVVDGTYRIRVKRHTKRGQVSAYLTHTSLEFLSQPPEQLVLFGSEKVHLIAGYQWDSETYEIGHAVLSLRDGLDNMVWIAEFPDSAPSSTSFPTGEPSNPGSPTIEIQKPVTEDAEDHTR